MTVSPEEQKIRARLPFIRFMQAYFPFGMANRLMKFANSRVVMPPGVTRMAVLAGGVPCEWLIPENSPEDRALLYIHGGGFVFAQTPLHLVMVAHLAQKMGIRALLVDYRVAPEHPYPAALDDCVTAYRWLIKQGVPARNLVVAGDSAGGNLTITTMMKLRDSGEPLPSAAACLSPVGDLSGQGHAWDKFHDPLLHPRGSKRYNAAYAGQQDPCDPLISPVFGDWRGLPPLLIHAGGEEILREDAVRMAGLAVAAGVDARLQVYPRMWHVWQLYLELPEARESLEEIGEFLKGYLLAANSVASTMGRSSREDS